MFDFSPKDQALGVHYLNARVTKEWADAFRRPDLADWVIGMAEVRAGVRLVSSTPSASVPYRPSFTSGFKDVSLGALSSRMPSSDSQGEWAQGLIGAIEERALWSRFGL